MALVSYEMVLSRLSTSTGSGQSKGPTYRPCRVQCKTHEDDVSLVRILLEGGRTGADVRVRESPVSVHKEVVETELVSFCPLVPSDTSKCV